MNPAVQCAVSNTVSNTVSQVEWFIKIKIIIPVARVMGFHSMKLHFQIMLLLSVEFVQRLNHGCAVKNDPVFKFS